MSEGVISNEVLAPKGNRQNALKVSKGYLEGVGDVKKRRSTRSVFSPDGSMFIVRSPEAEKITPTEASKGFLGDWRKRLLSLLDFATKMPMGFATTAVSAGLFNKLGGLDIQSDIAEGRWETLAAKGVLAGIAAAPAVRMVK